jgi:hypothetical protein
MIHVCPGCGVSAPDAPEIKLSQYNASSGCLQLYYGLIAYTQNLEDKEFIHQYVVDVYAAQHVGLATKSISTFFALVGLYLALEHNFTGKQVQRAHMLLAQKSKQWPRFQIPTKKASVTIADIMRVADAEKKEKIHAWMQSVWELWKPQQDTVAATVIQYGILPFIM